jgi:hypothetical protein
LPDLTWDALALPSLEAGENQPVQRKRPFAERKLIVDWMETRTSIAP